MSEREEVKVTVLDSHQAEISVLGLVVVISQAKTSLPIGHGIKIPKGTQIAQIGFTPFDRGRFIKGTRYSALLQGFRALEALFEVLDEGVFKGEKVPMPEYFYSSTNPQMAQIARHLGFSLERCSCKDGSIDILARVDDVRQNFERLKSRRSAVAMLERLAAIEEEKGAVRQNLEPV